MVDKSTRGTIQLIWSNTNYDESRDTEGFMGFSTEWTTGWGGTILEADKKAEVADGVSIGTRTNDNHPTPTTTEISVKRAKLSQQFALADHMGMTDAAGVSNARFVSKANASVEVAAANFTPQKLEEDETNGPFVFCEDMDYPNLQTQTIVGMRGSQLTLKKIELVYSKEDHNVEFVDVDLGSLIPHGGDNLHGSIHNGSTTNLIRCFSSGKDQREVHVYDTYIGDASNAQVDIGVRGIGYWPCLGQRCFGMRPGNDVLYQTFGTESTATSGTVNGHLLRVNIILERLTSA